MFDFNRNDEFFFFLVIVTLRSGLLCAAPRSLFFSTTGTRVEREELD